MPSGLTALLDDVAMIAKLASASIDDVTAAAAKAGAKTAGVVIDDAAVTPSYVVGLSPARELPIIWKITKGSLKNKLLYLLPAALLLSKFAPWLIIPILMIGGGYLAFEATEKILEVIFGHHEKTPENFANLSAKQLEKRQVAGAIRTDFILSAEIMAITLASLDVKGWWLQAAALALVAIVVTVAVYGLVAIIVKLDDVGLHLLERDNSVLQKLGSGLLVFVPYLLKGLSAIGTAAMMWVGGGIVLHGFESLNFFTALPHWVHHTAHHFSGGFGWLEWLLNALGSAVVGLIVGLITLGFVSVFSKYLKPSSDPTKTQLP